MFQRGIQRCAKLTFDRERQRLDMAFLTFSSMASDEFARLRCCSPRGLALLVEGMNAGAGNMREREIRIFGERALERLRCARPGRQHPVDAVAIGGSGGR